MRENSIGQAFLFDALGMMIPGQGYQVRVSR